MKLFVTTAAAALLGAAGAMAGEDMSFADIDTNADGTISMTEAQDHAARTTQEAFAKYDANADAELDEAEYGAWTDGQMTAHATLETEAEMDSAAADYDDTPAVELANADIAPEEAADAMAEVEIETPDPADTMTAEVEADTGAALNAGAPEAGAPLALAEAEVDGLTEAPTNVNAPDMETGLETETETETDMAMTDDIDVDADADWDVETDADMAAAETTVETETELAMEEPAGEEFATEEMTEETELAAGALAADQSETDLARNDATDTPANNAAADAEITQEGGIEYAAEEATMPADTFASVDLDADGGITLEEAQEYDPSVSAQSFADFDSDANTTLDMAEYASWRAEMTTTGQGDADIAPSRITSGAETEMDAEADMEAETATEMDGEAELDAEADLDIE